MGSGQTLLGEPVLERHSHPLCHERHIIDARIMHRGLLVSGYWESAMLSQHALLLENLPPIHRDPFDRILIAQPMSALWRD